MNTSEIMSAMIFGDGGASKVEELSTDGGSTDAGKVLVVGDNGKIAASDLTVGEGEVAIDKGLVVNGAAADAKVVGDAIASLNGSLENLRKGAYTLADEDILQGSYVSPGNLYNDATRLCSPKISVYEGETIHVTLGDVCKNANVAYIDKNGTYKALGWSANDRILTVPYDCQFVCIFSKSTSSDAILPSEYDAVLTVDARITTSVEQLSENYERINASIDELENSVNAKVTPERTTFFEGGSFNMINPDDITTAFYYSPGSAKIITATKATGYALSGLIRVEEGETYTYSGTGAITHGGYFTADAELVNNQAAVSAITFFNPVEGGGKCFTVPTDQNIAYVALNVNKNTSTQEINGTLQLEKGEMATEYQPYNLVYKIIPDYLPQNSGESPDSQISVLDVLTKPTYSPEQIAKISKFKSHWIKKDKDLVVVGTGTSLTARSSEHCTTRADATSRPPLMHSNNFASKIWDRIKWEGQQYRRFDYTGFFTETGTFASTHNLENWDDNNYRYGLTRYADGGASVAYTIPADAWQANFIYRTDSAGCENATVTVAEGNGVMVVWNGSTWVEANGYTFSMRETETSLSNLSIPDPKTTDNANVTVSTYKVGGNTTYQKRLKMKAVTRTATKTITISCASDRLLYWGVEWSPREYMITYINAARGSHNMTITGPNWSNCLLHYQDNDIWDFKPDLIFTENPIHNSGGSGGSISSYHITYWGYITYDFFFNTDNPVSFISRATAKGINVSDLEWVVFTSSLTWNFNGIDANGDLIVSADADGNMLTALDCQSLTDLWIHDNATNVLAINACKYWCDACKKLFGNMKDATVGSGKNGNTLTNEGSHWNDTGGAVMDRCIGGVFDFYT